MTAPRGQRCLRHARRAVRRCAREAREHGPRPIRARGRRAERGRHPLRRHISLGDRLAVVIEDVAILRRQVLAKRVVPDAVREAMEDEGGHPPEGEKRRFPAPERGSGRGGKRAVPRARGGVPLLAIGHRPPPTRKGKPTTGGGKSYKPSRAGSASAVSAKGKPKSGPKQRQQERRQETSLSVLAVRGFTRLHRAWTQRSMRTPKSPLLASWRFGVLKPLPVLGRAERSAHRHREAIGAHEGAQGLRG